MIGIERMILESSSFDFRYRHAQPFVVKFAKILECPKDLTQRAWDISVDVYKTLSPLKATPHTLALAALDLAARLQGPKIDICYDQFEATREVVLCRFPHLVSVFKISEPDSDCLKYKEIVVRG